MCVMFREFQFASFFLLFSGFYAVGRRMCTHKKTIKRSMKLSFGECDDVRLEQSHRSSHVWCLLYRLFVTRRRMREKKIWKLLINSEEEEKLPRSDEKLFFLFDLCEADYEHEFLATIVLTDLSSSTLKISTRAGPSIISPFVLTA